MLWSVHPVRREILIQLIIGVAILAVDAVSRSRGHNHVIELFHVRGCETGAGGKFSFLRAAKTPSLF